MDSTPVPPDNLAESRRGLDKRWSSLPCAVWNSISEFLHRRMPILGRQGSLRLLSGPLVMAVMLLIFGRGAAAHAALSPIPTFGEGGDMFIATLTPEGASPYGNGTAHLLLNPEQQTVCFVILVSDIKLPATAAHIQRGAAGVNGPIVLYLRPPNASGFSTGCTNAPRSLILAIMQHPVDYYVNVHNMPYPEGAVRGQLFLCTPDIAC